MAIHLRPRLAMVASLAPRGELLVDIGTDHGRLPTFLVENGFFLRAIATDISYDCLKNAKKTVESAGLCEKISIIQSNGFDKFQEIGTACWVLSGMGGTLMVRLLDRAPWLRRPGTVLVAQPQRHAHDLRAWLNLHGFLIEIEAACVDAGRDYHALRAIYTGKVDQKTPGYCYYGELLNVKSDVSMRILKKELASLGIKSKYGGKACSTAQEYWDLLEAMDDFSSRCI